MKIQRMLRISLMLFGVTFMFWIIAIPVKAEKTMENQNSETKQQEEEVIQIEDITGLDNEFGALEEESAFIVEGIEQYRQEAKRKGVQRIVVIVLAAAILGVGITTVLQEKKKNDGK